MAEVIAERVYQNLFAMFRRKSTSAFSIRKSGSPISERDQFIKPRNHLRLINARGAVDEVEHEIEDHFGIGAGEQRRKRLQRNAPAFWIDQEKRERTRR